MDDALKFLMNLPNGILVVFLIVAGIFVYVLWIYKSRADKEEREADKAEKIAFRETLDKMGKNISSVKEDVNKKLEELKGENQKAFNDINLKLLEIKNENKTTNRDLDIFKAQYEKEFSDLKACQKVSEDKVTDMDKRLTVVETETGIKK